MNLLKLILAFSIICFSFFVTPLRAQQWQKTTLPDSVGRINDMYIWGDMIFAATEVHAVWMSKDNGSTWTQKSNGLPPPNTVGEREATSFAVIGTELFVGALAPYMDGGVFTSSDSGSSWTSTTDIPTGLTYEFVKALAVIDSTLFAGTQDAGVFLSTNMGGNWAASNNGTSPGQKTALAFAVKDDYLFVSNNGLYRSGDAGNSWVLVNGVFGGPKTFTVSGDNIYAGGKSQEGIIFSTDNGNTWTSVNYYDTSGVGTTFWALASKQNTVFMGSNSDGIFKLLNGDTVLEDINENVMNSFIIASLTTDDTFLYAGTWGNGVWKRPLSELVTVDELRKDKTTVVVYPNPVSNTVSVEIQNAPPGGKQEFKIYDNIGKLVKRVNVRNTTFTINTENLPKGVYLYQLSKQNELLHSGKLIIQ